MADSTRHCRACEAGPHTCGLPTGTERFIEWGVRWPDGETWLYRDAEVHARRAAADPRYGRDGMTGQVVTRETYYVPPGPWVTAQAAEGVRRG